MKRTRILSVFLTVCMIVMCMVGMSISASADTSLSDCEVWVDVYEQTVTVFVGNENIPEDTYSMIFFSYAPTEGGESLERIGEEFPTEEGMYIAVAVAKEGSGYTESGRSEPFSVSIVGENDISNGEVWVDVYEQTVTVELNGETVPESEYHVIFFSYTSIEGGESLERVGTDFPTEEGQYIAAVVANEGSEYTGENRSESFRLLSGRCGYKNGCLYEYDRIYSTVILTRASIQV